jgi:hypothetical protein
VQPFKRRIKARKITRGALQYFTVDNQKESFDYAIEVYNNVAYLLLRQIGFFPDHHQVVRSKE